jgi:hypothetical protein
MSKLEIEVMKPDKLQRTHEKERFGKVSDMKVHCEVVNFCQIFNLLYVEFFLIKLALACMHN